MLAYFLHIVIKPVYNRLLITVAHFIAIRKQQPHHSVITFVNHSKNTTKITQQKNKYTTVLYNKFQYLIHL